MKCFDFEKKKCKNCGEKFEVFKEQLIAKMDDKRKSYYSCPYCNEVCESVYLHGNEEVVTRKL